MSTTLCIVYQLLCVIQPLGFRLGCSSNPARAGQVQTMKAYSGYNELQHVIPFHHCTSMHIKQNKSYNIHPTYEQILYNKKNSQGTWHTPIKSPTKIKCRTHWGVGEFSLSVSGYQLVLLRFLKVKNLQPIYTIVLTAQKWLWQMP